MIPQNHTNFIYIWGNPLDFSLSPFFQEHCSILAGSRILYKIFRGSAFEFSELLKSERCIGANITIPHKIEIIPYLDKLSKKAKLFGAVNTVENKKDKLIGHNTDCEGFLRALKGAEIDLKGRVLVLGSGGVSRMFAFESALAGADVTIGARNVDKALQLKKEIKEKTKKDCRIITLSTAGEYDLIINGTPVGMYPNADASPVPKEVVQRAGAVFDAVYNPVETRFISFAKEAGIKYCNGLSMLVWQAAVAEEIWNGVKFDEQDVEQIIEDMR